MFHVKHIAHIDMEITERIKMYTEYKGITVNKFEVSSGIARGSLRYIKQSIGSEKLSGIIKAFPDLNISWLITGEGEMLKESNSNSGINLGAIGGDNKSTYTNVGNSSNDKELEILKMKLELQNKEIERLEQISREKDQRLLEKEENIKVLKDMIELLKNK